MEQTTSLASYMEAAKGKQRTPNSVSIRFTTSFTPRLSGVGEYKRVAKELLAYAKEIAQEVLLLPWDDSSGLGPINIEDLANPKNFTDTIRHYFDKPAYVTMQPGTPAYGIGIRFSVNCDKFQFYNKWNIKKREYKVNNRAAYTITMAPMQNSPTAYIIGIAVGSTENQDCELLNKKLEASTGIIGIETSYQNIHQAGITPDFWKMANNKASLINSDKMSRDFLRTKYLWAPNALAIFVPKREMVNTARKTMIKNFGKPLNGTDPVWPDGSSMRFLPIKGSAIRNEKTKEVVRKRLAYHIWLKSHEISIDTNMVNIHDSIAEFEGKTFAEVVLECENESGSRLFSHFNRAWNNDPSQERWALSIKPNCIEDAEHAIKNLRENLFDVYGPEVNRFFNQSTENRSWTTIVSNSRNNKDEDDDWFEDDDDIDELIKQGIVDTTFIQFLMGKNDNSDKTSVASWGTGDTNYTEIIENQEIRTVSSSITVDTAIMSAIDTQQRKESVLLKLKEQGIDDNTIQDIMENKNPFELVFSGIHLPTWNTEKELFLINALLGSVNSTFNTTETNDVIK
jgi:hypothetical protein